MSEAYIQKSFKVLEEQYRYMLEHTDGLNADTRHFVNHIMVSTIQRFNNRNESLSIPVPSILIRKELRNVRLADAKRLLTIKPYSYYYGLCREYEVLDWYLDGSITAGDRYTAREYLKVDKFNLFTGKKAQAVVKPRYYDENRHSEPSSIVKAMKVLVGNGCLFNLDAVEQHVSTMKEEMSKALRDYGLNSKQYLKARGRYINDFYCSRSVLDQCPTRVNENGIYSFIPAYAVVRTGRLKQHGGGLQSSSRRMKHAAYSGIQGQRNYDLKGSQLAVLIQELLNANLDAIWLVRYLGTPDYKQVYAEKAGMSAECWKQCLIALVMGARFPQSVNYRASRFNSIADELLKEAEGKFDKANEILKRFKGVVEPLVKQLSYWHTYLINGYLQQHQQRSKKGVYIKNKVGKKLDLSELAFIGEARKAKSRLAAFLLQGQEAAFTHAVTVLGPEYGFKPISNEHDGLVVIGEIPDAAVRKAAKISGFENAELIEKPFL